MGDWNMPDTLVDVQGLSRDYSLPDGEVVHVLNEVNCRVLEGGHIVLIGPSGSGKSTLLHSLGGLIEPTRGRITWPALGEQASLMPEKLQFVFQSPSLYPALNVLGNVSLPLVLAGKMDADAVETRALEVLEQFGLAELVDKLPEELSGGQAQRVAMVRALAIRPRLILADEPTGQLDSKTAGHFLDQVLGMTEEMGAALVIATHDPAMAERMQLRWIIDHGTLQVPQTRNGVSA
jgi:putative ABC transport system ATP-binding protein/lipoprotein-releasing system ATP-binding protein